MAKGTADSSLVKKAHAIDQHTPETLAEFAKCADPVTGPLYFAVNYVKIQHPTKGSMPFAPFDYQIELLNNMHCNRWSINLLGRQMGKALALDTPILTTSGFSTVGDLSVGDIIYGRDGKPTIVTYITDTMTDRPCFEIEFAHGEKITADAEHLWNINLPQHPGEITVTTLELIDHVNRLENTAQSLHITHSNLLQFDETPVPLDPYYLGLWLGDGGTRDLRITSSFEDYAEYKEILSARGLTVSEFTLDKRSDTTGSFYVKGGASAFKQLGVWGNKHIPDAYLFNSAEIRIALLQGLMDSDGTCEKSGVSRFYQSNEKFIDQVRLLLSTLGIKSTKGMKKTTHKDAYTVCFAEKTIPVFALSRKRDRQKLLKDHPKNKRIYIKSINPVNSVPVRCLQVDNTDHMFLCGNTLIPTHNTTVAAAYLLWYAMFMPDSTILVAAHLAKGASEIMQRIRYAYENVPDFIRAGVTEYNKGSITFDNGSRIVSTTTTETTGRGMSLTLVYCDEFAFVRGTIAKEFWTSLSPTLATGGKCIVTSTPNSDEDTFATIWKQANNKFDEFGNEQSVGINGFSPMLAIWDRHPDRDEAWATSERGRIGEERFMREHACQFVIFDETLIDSLHLVQLSGNDPVFRTGQVRWYKQPSPAYMYAIALDPAKGTGGDSSAIQVLELPTMVQVAEWQHNKTPVEGQIKCMMDIMQYLRDHGVYQVYWTVENNGLGEAAMVVIRDTGEENFPGEFLNEPTRPGKRKTKGFHTSATSKIESSLLFKRLVEQKKIKLHSKPLISELKNFVARGHSYSAKPGEHDDLVTSMLMIVRMVSYISTFEDEVHNQINSDLSSMMGREEQDDYDSPMPMGWL